MGRWAQARRGGGGAVNPLDVAPVLTWDDGSLRFNWSWGNNAVGEQWLVQSSDDGVNEWDDVASTAWDHTYLIWAPDDRYYRVKGLYNEGDDLTAWSNAVFAAS